MHRSAAAATARQASESGIRRDGVGFRRTGGRPQCRRRLERVRLTRKRSSHFSLTAAGLRPAPPRGRRIRGGPQSRPVASPSRMVSLWIAGGKRRSLDRARPFIPPPPAPTRSFSRCMTRSWHGRRALCTAPWSGVRGPGRKRSACMEGRIPGTGPGMSSHHPGENWGLAPLPALAVTAAQRVELGLHPVESAHDGADVGRTAVAPLPEPPGVFGTTA